MRSSLHMPPRRTSSRRRATAALCQKAEEGRAPDCRATALLWAPIGERPIAPGHHRFDWLYAIAFVLPVTGETFWYVHDGLSKPFFAALLETFARGRPVPVFTEPSIVLVIDSAGWHGEAGLNIPEGVRLIFFCPTPGSFNRRKRCGAGRRARRQQACRHHRRTRRHHRQEMRRSRERTRCHQKPRRAPLVVKNRQCEAIRRKPYQKPFQLLVIAKPSPTEENLVIGI